MLEEKIIELISKLASSNDDLSLKIAGNKMRIRALVGKHAGVRTGDVVISKGQRYKVLEVLSDAVPSKGKPVLSGVRILKSGKLLKQPVEIKGAWSVESAAPKEIVRVSPRRTKSLREAADAPVRRRGRPSKTSLENSTVLGAA